jgi:membrane-bound serine protease (ClpP class)
MDTVLVIALIGVALLVGELLLPTGGLLAFLGAAGLFVAGVVALTAESDSTAADIVGPALITLGLLSVVTFYFITRKVIAAHRDEPVQTGREEMIGSVAEVRTSLDPEGQVWLGGALWRARLVGDGATARPGDRVVVEAVEGLTLVVTPRVPSKETAEEGAS